MDQGKALKNLVDIQKEFNSGFLAYGSALGAVREQDIIAHDLDTDFGVFDEDFNFAHITNLVRNGFVISSVFGMRHYGLEISLTRDGVKTDIMIIYDRSWNCLWDNGGKNGLSDAITHRYNSKIFDKIEKVKIKNEEFNSFGIPYIEAVYGKDWNIPVKNWNWRTDHHCNERKILEKVL